MVKGQDALDAAARRKGRSDPGGGEPSSNESDQSGSASGTEIAERESLQPVGLYGGDWRELTLRQLLLAVTAKQAHAWDMSATVASAWAEVDFSKNPFRPKRRTAGSFDTDSLARMHTRLKREGKVDL
ncbi:MAG: hypothetical protein U0930_20025 [Pirellulales bacterium]